MTLALDGLVHAYPGDLRAVDGVTLGLAAGERVALVGANGSGKTTLLLLAAGALQPAAGTVRLDGAALGRTRSDLDRWRRAVGFVMQDPDDQLFAATVAEDVAFGPANLGLDAAEIDRRVAWALDELRIADLAARPTHMLSLGQKKRLALAGVLAMRPRFLLFDEPTAGLDPLTAVHLMARLDRLARAGTAVMLATHDLDAAYGWADRVVVLDRGRVLAAGQPATVLADAATLRTARLRQPLLLEIGRTLQEQGVLPPGPLPRRRRELRAALKGK